MRRPDDNAALRASFRTAKPFPHQFFESFLGETRALELAKSFPEPAALRQAGSTYETAHEHDKIGCADENVMPPVFRELKQELHSAPFLGWLSEITGIDGLVADPLMIGGGMHRMGGDGKLDVHVDFSELQIHGQRYYRRLNLLLFLNPIWLNEWGGALELWDPSAFYEQVLGKDEKVSVRHSCTGFFPRLDRCAIFETSHDSWHGVSPLRAPAPRLSWAVYYYTVESPPGYRGLIPSTIFRMRPSQA